MEIHADCHNCNNCKYTDYGSNPHRHIATVYTETKCNSHNNKEQGNHCYRCRSRRFDHIYRTTLIIYCTKGSCYNRSKCSYHKDQCQIRENDKQSLGPFAHISRNNFANGHTFIADRSKKRTKVMYTTEENSSN